MNIPQLLALGGGILLIYSGIKGKDPLTVIKQGIAQSKTQEAPSPVDPTNVAAKPAAVAAPVAAKYGSAGTAIAKFGASD